MYVNCRSHTVRLKDAASSVVMLLLKRLEEFSPLSAVNRLVAVHLILPLSGPRTEAASRSCSTELSNVSVACDRPRVCFSDVCKCTALELFCI